MLTFEWDAVSEHLEIHADSSGLRELASHLSKLAATDHEDHIHLMTDTWGSEELSTEKQNEKAELIHHVKVFRWKNQ